MKKHKKTIIRLIVLLILSLVFAFLSLLIKNHNSISYLLGIIFGNVFMGSLFIIDELVR